MRFKLVYSPDGAPASSSAAVSGGVSPRSGVSFGRGNAISIGGNVIGTLVQPVIPSIQIPPYLHQLEPYPVDFTGRDQLLKDLIAAVKGGAAMIGLFGMGGVGKTALALRLAERLIGRYPDAQIRLKLRGTDPQPLALEDVLAYVIRSFHPMASLPETLDALLAAYRSALHGQRALLLLDNAHDADQVSGMQPPRGSLLLVTSRQRFSLPGLVGFDLNSLTTAEAAALLLRIAPRLARREAELARLCGYLPLALRVTATAIQRRRDLPVDDYLQRLQDAGHRLELTGVEASLRMSYDLLPGDLQRYWAVLSVFPGAFTRQAAAAVWNLADEPAQDTLGELLQESLLDYESAIDQYRLHDLARLAARKLCPPDDYLAGQALHAGYYLELLRAANTMYLEGKDQALAALRLFDLDWENIQAGQAWAAAHRLTIEQAARWCLDYPIAGRNLFDLRLHPQKWIDWLMDALDASRQINDLSNEAAVRRSAAVAQCSILTYLGVAHDRRGESRQAIGFYEQALPISRELADRRREGIVLGNLGNALADLRETRQAIDLYQSALQISREIGDPALEGTWLGNLGLAYSDLGEYRQAIAVYETALQISQVAGDRRTEANHLGNLGLAFLNLGLLQRANKYFTQAFEIYREIGDLFGEADNLSHLGVVFKNLGDLPQAIDYHQQALAIHRQMGYQSGEEGDLGNLGLAYFHLGDYARAIEYFEQAMTIARKFDDRKGEGYGWDSLGLASVALGDPIQAIGYHQQAFEIARQVNDRRLESWALGHLGEAHAALGDQQSALENLEQALTVVQATGDRLTEASWLYRLGQVNASLSRPASARMAWEQALDIYRSIDALSNPQAIKVAELLSTEGSASL